MAFVGKILMLGQSNNVGNGDNGGSGGSAVGAAAGDSGGGFANAFASCLFAQSSSVAGPQNPMVYNTNFGVTGTSIAPVSSPVSLQIYSGTAPNVGSEQSLGRALVKYGIAANPRIIKCGVYSSSLPVHWAKASGFPATGGTIYNHAINLALSDISSTGVPYDCLIWTLGETDMATPSRITSAVSDLTTFFGNVRTDLGIPNLPVGIVLINTATTAGLETQANQYRAQQIAYQATDPNCFLIDPNDIPLHAAPHYDMCGYWSIGDRIAFAIKKFFVPGINTNLGTSASAYYQQDDPISTCQVSPSVATPREGPEPQDGDWELLVVTSYTEATTHTLTTTAGFTSLIAQTESTFATTTKRTMSVWIRKVTTAAMTVVGADGVARMPIPVIDCGSARMNIAKIITIRNAHPTTPVALTSIGVNNTNGTTVTIPANATSVPAGSLVMFLAATAGTTNGVSSIVNAGVGTVTVHRDSRVNPGAGVVGLAFATAQKSATGSLASTAVTFLANGVNVGAAIVFNVAPNVANAQVSTVGAGTQSSVLAASIAGATVASTGAGSALQSSVAALAGADVAATGSGSLPAVTGQITVGAAGAAIGAGSQPSAAAGVQVSAAAQVTSRNSLLSSTLSVSATPIINAEVVNRVGKALPDFTASVAVQGDAAGTGAGTTGQVIAGALALAAIGGVGSGTLARVLGAVSDRAPPGFVRALRITAVWSDGSPSAPEVPQGTAVPIDWPRGQSGLIEVDFVDQDGEPIDLDFAGGDNLVLSVNTDFDGDPIVTLTAQAKTQRGVYVWSVSTNDTIDLAGKLIYDVWATRSGISRQVVSTSYFTILPRAKR